MLYLARLLSYGQTELHFFIRLHCERLGNCFSLTIASTWVQLMACEIMTRIMITAEGINVVHVKWVEAICGSDRSIYR
jgi:hypothetical protein